MFLWNEIRDYDVDRKTGIRNTASVFDVRRIEPILPHLFVWPSVCVAGLVLLNLRSCRNAGPLSRGRLPPTASRLPPIASTQSCSASGCSPDP
jgi:hypothetical protein